MQGTYLYLSKPHPPLTVTMTTTYELWYSHLTGFETVTFFSHPVDATHLHTLSYNDAHGSPILQGILSYVPCRKVAIEQIIGIIEMSQRVVCPHTVT